MDDIDLAMARLTKKQPVGIDEQIMTHPIVILESPYAGDIEMNHRYTVRAIRDSLNRGEAPMASHILYTEALDDHDPEQRKLGIDAGLAFGRVADKTVVYTDRGISDGMKMGINHAVDNGRPVEYRRIDS